MSQTLQIVKFAPKGTDSFYDSVKIRVNDYFNQTGLSKQGNWSMYFKTIVMLSIYFIPYIFIVTNVVSSNLLLFYSSWLIMGIGIAGIGCSVMHDSNHESYSNNKTINTLLGGVLNILGGYSRNWRLQHNILHHTYTNLDGLDEDIDAGILLRMSPHRKLLGIHKYQHLYAWVLYGIMNIYWVTVKDYKCLIKYNKTGLLKKEKISFVRAISELTFYKVIYFGYILVLPLLFTQLAWYHVVLGFVTMHMLAGLLLACIFQLAHVMETSEYAKPDDNRKMENNWAVHQILNTANFAPKNYILSWFVGGLNYQIEHHLFPHICHIHYPKLSAIVKKTAEEYNLPYNVQPTFIAALSEHAAMLKKLGRS